MCFFLSFSVCVIQVFFLQKKDHPKGVTDTADHNRLTERLARTFCLALCPYLKLLKEDGMAKLGLRITLDSQQVRTQNSDCVWQIVLFMRLYYT